MKRILLIITIFLIIISCAKSNKADINKLSLPKAIKKAHITEIHNMKLSDDYFWMRYQNDDVINHIKRENAYTDEIMKKNENLIEIIYEEMIGRLKENDLSVPYRMGNYIYYYRTEKGKQYPIYLRKKAEENAKEELLIDVNKMSDGFAFYDIGAMQISPDENLLMYLVDTTGNENYSLYILNIETRNITDEGINNISSVEWASDNRTMYYTLENEASRPYKVLRHEIFTNAKNDEELFRDENDQYWIWLSKSQDDKYIFIGISSKLTSYMMYIDASDISGTFSIVKKQEKEVK
ncbi:oligopeptidase B, partial [candidate division WOR-3 bacterium]|nr:oligopeptidase B [candidate division WOR-3 bacterium]